MIGTVLVFGVSGVGKTTSCADFASRHQNVAHYSASDLLRSATGISPEALRTSSRQRITANQSLVAGELARRVEGRPINVVLLDAHSVIDNGVDLVPVPLQTIRALAPIGLVLLEADPAIISARRRSHPNHPLSSQSVDRIQAQINATREGVLGYGEALDLPVRRGVVEQSFRLDSLIFDLVPSRPELPH